MVKIEELKSYKNFGRVLRIAKESLEMLVTLDVGPRIIRFGFENADNMMFEDENREISRSEEDMKKFGDLGVWYIYGGHRLWASPEEFPRTYDPENCPYEYKLLENKVSLIGPSFDYTGIQKQIDISVENDTFVITHKITNTGTWDKRLAAWPLTVLNKGGTEVIKLPQTDTGLLSNSKLVIWPYTKLNDSRVSYLTKYILLKQDETATTPFKLGFELEEAKILYFNKNCLFIKKYEIEKDVEYPDYGCNFETYTNEHFLEMESLSKLYDLKPGQTLEHTENWTLYNNVELVTTENELDKIYSKFE